MPKTAKFSRFLLRYTDTATRTTRPNENMRNSSQAVLGHFLHTSPFLQTPRDRNATHRSRGSPIQLSTRYPTSDSMPSLATPIFAGITQKLCSTSLFLTFT